MDQWTTYLIGGGGLGLISALIWKLLSATVSGVQAENVRLAARMKSLEQDYDDLLKKARQAERDLSDLWLKHNDLARQVTQVVPGVNAT